MNASRRGALKVVASCASNGKGCEGVLVVLPCLGGGCAWKARNAPEDGLDAIVVVQGSKANKFNRCSYAIRLIAL